jgi:hypothetical protein
MTIAKEIIKYTCENSNFNKKRNYISLSHIYLPIEDIVNQFKNGFEENEQIKLKCYKGYQMEKDLLLRMIKIYGERICIGHEIKLKDNLVQGHPDFTFDDYPGDCKSVLMDNWLPELWKIPKKAYWQMQAYMLYMKKEKALLIYETRETGLIKDYWIKENKSIQQEIEDKIEKIIDLL